MTGENLYLGAEASRFCGTGGMMEIISPKMDFAFRELMEDDRYHSVYRMRDERGKDYSDLLELHIIELRKTLTGNNRLDDWIRLFNAETEEDLHMIKTKNAGVQRAKYVIQEMSLTEAMRDALESYRKRKMDRKFEDAYVYDQGKEAGEQIGMERGIERGIERGVELGIEAFILDNLEENIPRERIIEKMQKRFQLQQSKAEAYFERYSMMHN